MTKEQLVERARIMGHYSPGDEWEQVYYEEVSRINESRRTSRLPTEDEQWRGEGVYQKMKEE